MASVLERLEVLLSLDDRGLSTGLNTAANKIDRVGRRISGVGRSLTRNVTPAIAAVGVAAVGAAVKVGNFADKLLDLSEQSNLSTDQLQEFRRVAVGAGVGADTVADAAQKMATRFAQGAEGSADLRTGLAELGISAKDANGNLRPVGEIADEAIQKLAAMDDQSRRNVLAFRLFSRGAKELLPILGLGAEEIARLRQEAHDLGLVMSEEQLQTANEFRKQWDSLKQTLEIAAAQIGLALIPALERIVPIVEQQILPAVRKFSDRIRQLDPDMVILIAKIAGIAAVAGPALTAIGRLTTGLAALRVVASPGGLLIGGLTALAGTLHLVQLRARGVSEETRDAIAQLGKIGQTAATATAEAARAQLFSQAVEAQRLRQEVREAERDVAQLREKLNRSGATPFSAAGQALGRLFSGDDGLDAAVGRLNSLKAKLEETERNVDLFKARLVQLHTEGTSPAADSIGDLTAGLGTVPPALAGLEPVSQDALRALDGLGGGTRTASEEFGRLATDIAAGRAHLEEFTAHVADRSTAVLDRLQERLEAVRGRLQELTFAAQSMTDSVLDAFTGFVTGANGLVETVRDAVQRILDQFVRLKLQETLAGPLDAFFGGLVGVPQARKQVSTAEAALKQGQLAAAGVALNTAAGAHTAAAGAHTAAAGTLAAAATGAGAALTGAAGALVAAAGALAGNEIAKALAAGAKLPKRALGGPVIANRPHIVGERGPEIFIPDRAGTIVPNMAMAGAGGREIHVQQAVTFVADSPDMAAGDRWLKQHSGSILRIMRQAARQGLI